MSWFRHKPKLREVSKVSPRRSGQMSEKILKDTKEEVRKPSKPDSSEYPSHK